MLLLLKNVFDFPLAPSRLNHFNCFQTGSLRAQLSTTNWGVESFFFHSVTTKAPQLPPSPTLHTGAQTCTRSQMHLRLTIYNRSLISPVTLVFTLPAAHLKVTQHSFCCGFTRCPVFFSLPITWFYLSSLKTMAIKSKGTKVKCKML